MHSRCGNKQHVQHVTMRAMYPRGSEDHQHQHCQARYSIVAVASEQARQDVPTAATALLTSHCVKLWPMEGPDICKH